MNIMSKFMKIKEDIISDELYETHYCLLETVSLLKFKAYEFNKDGFGEEAEILNIINTLRDLAGKSIYINENITFDEIMQLNFELGIFYKEFSLLCKKLVVHNPLESLKPKEMWLELSVLNEIDVDYFSNPKTKKYKTSDKLNYTDLELKMYDTLFYLREHFIFNYDEKTTDLHNLYEMIDKYLYELEELLKKRSKSNISSENENISFRLGKVVEALDTIAYDYDLPNELSSSFIDNVSDFYVTLSRVLLELNKNKKENRGNNKKELKIDDTEEIIEVKK